jgi:hypothetical protein
MRVRNTTTTLSLTEDERLALEEIAERESRSLSRTVGLLILSAAHSTDQSRTAPIGRGRG